MIFRWAIELIIVLIFIYFNDKKIEELLSSINNKKAMGFNIAYGKVLKNCDKS